MMLRPDHDTVCPECFVSFLQKHLLIRDFKVKTKKDEASLLTKIFLQFVPFCTTVESFDILVYANVSTLQNVLLVYCSQQGR